MKHFAAAALAAAVLLPACSSPQPGDKPVTDLPIAITDAGHPRPPFAFSPEDEKFLEEIQRGCFNYFWNAGKGPGHLVPDRTSIPWLPARVAPHRRRTRLGLP
jgi:hypothetical protein